MSALESVLFSREALEAEGFCGWVPFSALRQSGVPSGPGVYVVHDASRNEPAFLEASPAGWFKGKNPSVDVESLRANWVAEAEIVYIGKANNLRRRLFQFADFGVGKPIGHWGGRIIWQLAGSSLLLVAWRETPDDDPRAVEAGLIAQFRRVFGKAPFANDPHRRGR